jgi:FtsP/CotA-like multicopper oxidase with cupredoxin domain
MIDRRGFLRLSAAGAAASVLAGCSTRGAEQLSAKDSATGALEVSLNPGEADVDLGGVRVRTWAYNGQVPAKEIRLKKGQMLRVPVVNKLPAETSVHWHGLAIPNAMDGVPVLTQPAIAPGGTFTYEFAVPDAGTYYLHSHVGLQLDRGLYGPLIIEDPEEKADYDHELVVVLDDWIDGTGTTPDQVIEGLRATGMKSMATTPGAGVTTVNPLGDDGGDVTYPYYLINGHVNTDPQVVDFTAGQRIRLRIINAGGDSAFRVGVPGSTLTVTHTDGYPVIPRQADAVVLGMGERADAIVTVGASVPLVAAAERKDGYAQLNLRVAGAPSSVDVGRYVVALRATAPLNTATLGPAPNVVLPQRDPNKVLDLQLAGPEKGYTWPINGKLYDPPNNGLDVTANERVRIRYVNTSRMFHPMHLHGHTFQVVGARGPGPRKDTVLVPPLQTLEVDFDTDNPGKWITHCHNDYHLDSGMATFIAYT